MSEPLPARIGKYPVLRALGRGTTSSVYLAENPFSGMKVAIKVVQIDAQSDPEVRRRFHS